MVTTIEEILDAIRSNPFIDGVGYFVEVTTAKKLPRGAEKALTELLNEHFCEHAQATVDGEDVVGLDFHEHLFTQGEGADEDLSGLERILKHIESKWGINHLCIEFQFDFQRARGAKKELDELLKP